MRTVARGPGPLSLVSLVAMAAGAVVVVPAGLTLNPSDPAATLAAVAARPGLHLTVLALDVAGWLALAAAGLLLAALAAAARGPAVLTLLPASAPAMSSPGASGAAAPPLPAATPTPAAQAQAGSIQAADRAAAGQAAWQAAGGSVRVVVAGGLLAAAGVAGLLHDAGNLAVTQLAADPANAAVAAAVLLTAKWSVNLAGLLWVTATAALAGPVGLPRSGLAASLCGLAAVVLPWTTGTAGPPVGLEQAGYALHLPVMVWTVVALSRTRGPAAGSSPAPRG